MVKIYTEGYDYFVLKGIDFNLLKPSIIICEYEDVKSKVLGYRLQDMLNYLEKYDYKIIISEWYPIRRYGKNITGNNFYFLPSFFNISKTIMIPKTI